MAKSNAVSIFRPEHVRYRTFFTPAGDLTVIDDIVTRSVSTAHYVTAAELVGQAAEYTLNFTYSDDGQPCAAISTLERGGHHLHTDFIELPITPRDPYAVRMREFVELVNAV